MVVSRAPEVTALFTIGGDFEPDVVTKALRIEPTNVWSQKRPHLDKRADLNRVEWSVGVEKMRTDSIEAAIADALESVWKRRTRVQSIVEHMQLRPVLVCNVTYWGDRPEYVLSPETMGKLSVLGAEFCLDIFDYSEDSDIAS